MNSRYEPGVESVFWSVSSIFGWYAFPNFRMQISCPLAYWYTSPQKLVLPMITSHSTKNFAFIALLRWKILGECTFELGSERVSGQTVFAHRYGNEDKLATLMGVMQALTAFVQDDNNLIRFVTCDISLICNLWHKKMHVFSPLNFKLSQDLPHTDSIPVKGNTEWHPSCSRNSDEQ